jgi:Asp/Glu/hydantoin racemase
MDKSLFVINPNSNTVVTAGIDAAMQPFRSNASVNITCLTLAEGPPGIQSERDVASVALPMEKLASSLADKATGFVIACFSDPGIHLMREALPCPVYGIAESGAFTAMTLGHRFGVIAILETSIPRHLRYWEALGVSSRLAGEQSIGLNVSELSDADKTFSRMVAAGKTLRDSKQANVIVMGCAGMAAYRDPLEKELGIPVVEPTQAAVAMALGASPLGWSRRPGA